MEKRPRDPEADLDVTPLLRSIAAELVSRSLAIIDLEARIEATQALQGDHDRDVSLLMADLATQRRELRRAENELKRLGWKRDQRRPLRFLSATSPDEAEWQLAGTGFYRSLDATSAD